MEGVKVDVDICRVYIMPNLPRGRFTTEIAGIES